MDSQFVSCSQGPALARNLQGETGQLLDGKGWSLKLISILQVQKLICSMDGKQAQVEQSIDTLVL